MLCFAYDYDRYNEERGLYFDIRKELASERLSDENILVDTIIKLDWEERSRISIDFRDKYVESFGDATQKSLDYLYNVLNQK